LRERRYSSTSNVLNGGKGIGVDPAYEEGRQKNPNLTFYKEFYSEKHGNLKAAMISCRHTLEHIHGTYDFLKLIRQSLNDSPDTVVFFEIPQISRILDIQAFWNILMTLFVFQHRFSCPYVQSYRV
jgi:hypothetical protein